VLGGGAVAGYEPTTETTERLLARVSASGARVSVDGALPVALPAGNPIVRRDARAGDGRAPQPGGSGIAALRRRVAPLGGSLTAGVAVDGFTLTATLPLHPAVPGRTPQEGCPGRDK